MPGPLVPPELLAALPGPWQLADPNRRRAAVEARGVGPEQRAAALSALEACLAYMADVQARYGDDPGWGLPDGFYDYHPFALDTGLHRSLPTLADITPDKVSAWIETDVDAETEFGAAWTTPPDEVVGSVGRVWAFSIVNGLTEYLIRWFRGRAREHLDASERAQLIRLFKEAVPRQPWRLAILTVPGILDLGGPGEKEYFDRLAGDHSLYEKVRAEAESVRSTGCGSSDGVPTAGPTT